MKSPEISRDSAQASQHKMRILFVTGNSLLRSTTSSLNGIIRSLRPQGVEPVMVFRERGPWTDELEQQDIRCFYLGLRPVEKQRPVSSLIDTLRLFRLIRQQ